MQCVRNARTGLMAGNLCHSILLYPLIPKMRWPLHSLLAHCRRISAGRKTCAVCSALLPPGRGRSSHLLSVQSNVVPQGPIPISRTYLTSKLLPSWKAHYCILCLLSHPPSFLHVHCAAGFLSVIYWPSRTQIYLPSAENTACLQVSLQLSELAVVSSYGVQLWASAMGLPCEKTGTAVS